ncbi:MAG: CidB/LrgB family autolysis modulator [Desulfuromonadales bacterium GWD2_61_12]|nr:MAG: CidB/LrgB family autolysis modulator [Desulfuromonadales bacterium GWC2_61_20]OGR32465.1 MAG: CidB/LrgB family autolysis modulator [Desulfuromonadales bacterium GWD2_61_12]HAD04511.1 CidB/LrgB family autolysis modulator [Desulfuromonas sp.]HBT82237.1 CidB/LrgB family autolysis modulator [Desulfuromonas sp.]
MVADLVAGPLFGVTATLTAYALAQVLYLRSGMVLLNPVVVSVAGIVTLLLLAEIPYTHYAAGGRVVLFLLGPAVVALAVPLYQRRQEILAQKVPILAGVAVGAVTSVITAAGLAWLLGASREVVWSLAPKSVTTPVAIGIAEKIGGVAPLTASVVVLTGCLGAVCGPEFCRWIGIREPTALGLAIGTASHGIGTARVLEFDRIGGAVSGLAIGLNGLLTAFLLPLIYLVFR